MTRTRLAAPLLLSLALAACGKAAPESDDPQPAAGSNAASGAASGAAVAQASAAAAGETPAAFGQCKVCHTTEPGKHLIGPSLSGIHGRPAAAAPGYPYSTALKQAGLTWDDATLDRFLEAPMKTVPGTKMAYAGIKDAAKRREVIDYLKTL